MTKKPDTSKAPNGGADPSRRPFGRRLSDFDKLNAAEQRLRAACAEGKRAYFGKERPASRSETSAIRAGVLRFFLLGGDEQNPVHERGVDVKGAWIDGTIDLVGCAVATRASLWSCVVDGRIELRDATVSTLSLRNSKLEQLDGRRLNCTGTLFLNRGFRATRGVSLIGASIHGDLDCAGGVFENPQRVALNCDGIRVENRVFLRQGFRARGAVSLRVANISNGLYCNSAFFENKKSVALTCNNADIGAGFSLNHARVIGEVQAIGAKIANDFSCGGARFISPGGVALNADGITVGGRVFLRATTRNNIIHRFYASGEVRFVAAKITNVFECSGAQLRRRPGRAALDCTFMQVGGALIFRDVSGFSRPRLTILQVLRSKNPLRRKLRLIRARLRPRRTGVISFRQASAATLTDDLASWQIASSIVLDGLRYDRLNESPTSARTRIRWLACQLPFHLKRDFRTQPWLQAARVLTDMGHENDAKKIRIAMRARLRHSQWIHQYPPIMWPVSFLRTRFDAAIGVLVGYGYRPWRAVWFLAAIWFAGVAIFAFAANEGLMTPVDGKVSRSLTFPAECKINWVTFSGPRLPTADEIDWADERTEQRLRQQIIRDKTRRAMEANRLGIAVSDSLNWRDICRRALPPEYTDFNPWLYSADLLVPFLDARQKSFWRPRNETDDGASAAAMTSIDIPHYGAVELKTAHVQIGIRAWQWLETAFGWALLLLIGGTVSGLIRKD